MRTICIGGACVAYRLTRSRRRTLGFCVGREGLIVRAPLRLAVREIEAAIAKKGRWIAQHLERARERERQQAAARIEWRDGAVLPYLGEPVVIAVDARRGGPRAALLDDVVPPGVARRSLRVALPNGAAADKLREAVCLWLYRQAHEVFHARCLHYAPRLGVEPKRLALTRAATRWGSASADGSIRLNWRLIHFGLPIIDYVVAHELAHLREMNHGPRFWSAVASVVPDFRQARSALRACVVPDLD